MDHDQRFKTLLEEFFPELFELFWPDLARRLDFARRTWLKQEVFADPPAGERQAVDLLCKLPLLPPAAGEAEELLALIHAEVESRESVVPLRKRMYDYYHPLRRNHGLPVLPVALLLRVGLDGVGVDSYEEHFLDFRTVHFQFLYVGLPGLDGEQYLNGSNWLGVALSALMRLPAERRVELTAQALERLVGSPENMWRKFLLCECVQAYAPLSGDQRRDLDRVLVSERYSGVGTMVKTWSELGEEKGQRKILRRQLEKRFGALSKEAQARFETWPADRLEELAEALLTANSLKELGLEE
jgi:hypothetical protein